MGCVGTDALKEVYWDYSQVIARHLVSASLRLKGGGADENVFSPNGIGYPNQGTPLRGNVLFVYT